MGVKNMSSSISKNLSQRTSADLFRVLTLALQQKVHNQNLADVSIVRLELSPDFGTCRVFVTGGVEELSKMTAFFRNEIAQSVKIRKVPNLRFLRDDGEKNAQRVEELLGKINSQKANEGN